MVVCVDLMRCSTVLQSLHILPLITSVFPVLSQLSPKHGVIYLVSRGGYVIVVDALTGTVIFRHNVSKDAVFVACGDSQRGGLIFANRKGKHPAFCSRYALVVTVYS